MRECVLFLINCQTVEKQPPPGPGSSSSISSSTVFVHFSARTVISSRVVYGLPGGAFGRVACVVQRVQGTESGSRRGTATGHSV